MRRLAVFQCRLSAPKVGTPGNYPAGPPLILALIATCQKGEHLKYYNVLRRNVHNMCHLPIQLLQQSTVFACYAQSHLSHCTFRKN
jgi:hypothetical protein